MEFAEVTLSSQLPMWAQLSIKTALPLTLRLINIHMEELDSYREGGDDSYRSNL